MKHTQKVRACGHGYNIQTALRMQSHRSRKLYRSRYKVILEQRQYWEISLGMKLKWYAENRPRWWWCSAEWVINASHNSLALCCGCLMSLNAFDQRYDMIAVKFKVFYSKNLEIYMVPLGHQCLEVLRAHPEVLLSPRLFSLLLSSLTQFQVLLTRHLEVIFLTVSCFLNSRSIWPLSNQNPLST